MTAPIRPHSIALIDISYLFKKRYHTVNDGTPFAAAKATLRDIDDLKRGVGHVIICRDAPPYSHRLAIFADYKANRPVPEPEEKAQRKHLFAELQRLSLNVAWAQGYEADDVIATLAKAYGQWCRDVRIVGPDKDAAQCITENVTQYIPPVGDRDWEVRDVAAVKKKFGVMPAQMVLYQGLVGDSGDNIPGVPKIGEKTAQALVHSYGSFDGLAQGLAVEAAAQGSKPSAVLQSLAANWESLVMSMKLAKLDTAVPLDTESLLVVREPLPHKPRQSSMEVPFDGFIGNETPMPPKPEPEKTPLEVASKLYQEKIPDLKAVKDAELLEKEYDREREQSAENDTTSNEPGDKSAESVVVPRRSTALASVPVYTESKYGLVTKDLQPIDLVSARTVSEWLCDGGMYPQFGTPQAVFSVIARGKELGIGMTTALAGHHFVDNKIVASADLIRALVERDPTFMYLYPKEMSATKVVWIGARKGYPEPIVFPYTIEEAKAAGMVKLTSFGKPGNWMTRPQDMLMKTAASKLARILWPAATMGLYCPEEMGYTAEELDAREAA